MPTPFFMDYDTLDRLQKNHTAWRLLAASNAPLILSFLALAFIRPNRRAIAAAELIAHLSAYLEQLAEMHGPDRYPRSAAQYLDEQRQRID